MYNIDQTPAALAPYSKYKPENKEIRVISIRKDNFIKDLMCKIKFVLLYCFNANRHGNVFISNWDIKIFFLSLKNKISGCFSGI